MTYRIFKEIADNASFVSGEALGKIFGISRAAIAKHIKKLQDCGLDIVAGKGGYKYNDTECLCEYTLRQELNKVGLALPSFVVDCESAFIPAKSFAQNHSQDFVVVAPTQTKGRGRLGRTFESTVGGAYFCLVHYPIGVTVGDSVRLVLLAGMAVAKVCQMYGLDPKLKWPNDVHIDGKKISGIALESSLSMEFVEYVVFGIGINVYNDLSEELSKIATTLFLEKNIKISRITIIVQVLLQLFKLLEVFKSSGFDVLKSDYLSLSKTIGNMTTVKGSDGIIEGFATGLSDEGFLILDTKDGSKKIVTGDVL